MAHRDLSIPTALRGDAGSSRGPTAGTIGSQGLLGSSSCTPLPRIHPRILPGSAALPAETPRRHPAAPRPALRPRRMAQTLQSCSRGTDLRTRLLAGPLGRSGQACSVLVLGARAELAPEMPGDAVDKLARMNRAELLSDTHTPQPPPANTSQVVKTVSDTSTGVSVFAAIPLIEGRVGGLFVLVR